MARILVSDPEYFDEDALKVLKSAGKVTRRKMTPRQLASSIGLFDAVVVRVDTKLDRRVLSKATRLKVIGSATTGLDHIDIGYAKGRGIKIISLHGAHTIPTAEHTMALMLSLARKIPWALESMEHGIWNRHEFVGVQLQGKTLGIVGVGRIGGRVIGYAKAFGMRVIGCDPYVKRRDIEMVSLGRLLKESDIITLHPELTNETRHMISYKQLKTMKRSALLINTSRGEVVATPDLLRALKEGMISGAALDVFPEEPHMGKNNRFVAFARRSRRLIITPHLGASTSDAIHKAGMEIAKGVKVEMEKLH